MYNIFSIRNNTYDEQDIVNFNILSTTGQSICPHCHKGVNFNTPTPCVFNNKKQLAIVGICPLCNNFAFYTATITETQERYYGAPINTQINFDTILPYLVFKHNFQSELETISPNFIKTYEETKQAQLFQLYTLVGIGFRKALEELFFDYIKKS